MPFIPALGLFAYLGYIPGHAWPTNVPHLLWAKGPQQRRRIGSTSFADTSRYKPYTLSAEDRQQYFRQGWVHLKGVLPAELLSELRESLLRSGVPLWPWSINGHMMHDELLDFYLFSPLGQIASQVFNHGPALLWSDFRFWREKGQQISDWHYDGGECEHMLLLANNTARARLRFWVSLDDDVPGPVMAAQTLYDDILPAGQPVEDYWAGKLVGGAPIGATGPFLEDPLTNTLIRLNSSHLRHFAEPRARIGDVIMHSPCLLHKSPMLVEQRTVGFLCPTYQPHDSRYFTNSGTAPEASARNCKHDLKVGDSVAGHPCYPQAYPPPEHLRGKEVDFNFASGKAGDGSVLHWYSGFVGRRIFEMGTWEGFWHFTSGSSGAVERPLAWLTCRAAAVLGRLALAMPGVYVG